MTCPTVKVRDEEVEGGYQIINRSDFDPKVHEVYEDDGSHARTERAKELKGLSADEVKEIAVKAGIEYSKKGEAIEAILESEFPE